MSPFDLEPGQYSEPIEIGETIFILFAENKREEMIQPISEVRDIIENVLVGELAREAQAGVARRRPRRILRSLLHVDKNLS